MAPGARILVAGQAPGRKVHESGVPFQDASGDRLRRWMGVTAEVFYDPEQVAILPMGFCYPGTGSSGDLPPRPECAPLWRQRLLDHLTEVRLTLVIGQYALRWHLPDAQGSLAEIVRAGTSNEVIALPHPSPRNNRWLQQHPWFEAEVVPSLQRQVREVLEPTRKNSS